MISVLLSLAICFLSYKLGRLQERENNRIDREIMLAENERLSDLVDDITRI